jgi:hypothetical protein
MPQLSFRATKRLGLAASEEVILRFIRGEPALSAEAIGGLLHIPSHLLSDILTRLSDAGVLMESASQDGSGSVYVPSRDPRLLPPGVILDALERLGEDLDGPAAKASDQSANALDAMDRCLRESPGLSTAVWAPGPPST